MPSPEEACNGIIRRLLEGKQIDTQMNARVKEQAVNIVKSINCKEIDLIQL